MSARPASAAKEKISPGRDVRRPTTDRIRRPRIDETSQAPSTSSTDQSRGRKPRRVWPAARPSTIARSEPRRSEWHACYGPRRSTPGKSPFRRAEVHNEACQRDDQDGPFEPGKEYRARRRHDEHAPHNKETIKTPPIFTMSGIVLPLRDVAHQDLVGLQADKLRQHCGSTRHDRIDAKVAGKS